MTRTHIVGEYGLCARCRMLIPRITREEQPAVHVTVPVFPGDHVGIIESRWGDPLAYLIQKPENDSNQLCEVAQP